MRLILCITSFVILYSCHNQSGKKLLKPVFQKQVRIEKSSEENVVKKDYWKELRKTIPDTLVPIFGHRFIIKGDFDGNGKTEKLTEHFFSGKDNKEASKLYEGLNYDQLVMLTGDKEPNCFISCSNKKINDLPVANISQLLGLSYLKNEGDLNADGTDEISYVIDWADWSNLNSCTIMTYKNKKWQKLYSFDIWDWQLPPLPQYVNQYGYFGQVGKIPIPKNDTINIELEKELKAFPGFIKKIKANKILVRYRNKDAEEDTMIVNLKHIG